MEDFVVEIVQKERHILRDLYAQNKKEHYLAYATIENFIQLIDQNQNEKHVKLFCLNGDFSDGTFIAIVSNAYFFSLFLG